MNRHEELERRFACALRQEGRPTREKLLAAWERSATVDDRAALVRLVERRRLRNALIETPGAIAEEIRKTGEFIHSLGRDVHDQLAAPYEKALDDATAKFQTAHGREARTDDDWKELASTMGVQPGGREITVHAFHPEFYEPFQKFVGEWSDFRDGHQSWTSNMWGHAYEMAIDFRQRAIDWRKQFEALGGHVNSPNPTMPSPSLIPWGKVLTALGIVAGIVVVPAVMNAVRR
jgi:hypothetical protein